MADSNDSQPPFAAGTLWQQLVAVSKRSLRNGHLQPIATRVEKLVDGGAEFNVRVLANLQRKFKQRREQPEGFNPFLPYEQELFVANVSDRHVALLNKFNVVDHHLLIVTRQFETQESALTASDFQALWLCLLEFESLGFYNSGTIAGASQPHKHLQILPLGDDRGAVPLEPLFDLPQQPVGELTQATRLPFRHCLARLPAFADARAATNVCSALYDQMLASVGWSKVDASTPYNLIVTREWMLFVPRTAECYRSISLNSMAFVGSLFVKSQEQLSALKSAGPLLALRSVTSRGSQACQTFVPSCLRVIRGAQPGTGSESLNSREPRKRMKWGGIPPDPPVIIAGYHRRWPRSLSD